MTLLSPDAIALFFVALCRVGGCLMLTPAFSGARVPTRIRLFLAIFLTFALLPGLGAPRFPNLGALGGGLFSELFLGGLIGLLGRLFFLALETLMMAVALQIGISNPLGAPIDENEPLPAISDFITTTATVMIFASDLHFELIRGLARSFQIMPIGFLLDPRAALVMIADQLASSFVLCLRIASPFVVYAVAVNLAIGLLNRLTPQIPVYFVSAPFVIAGGLVLFYFISGTMVGAFMAAFGDWATRGD